MKTLTDAVAALKLSEKSCREEASGNLDGDRSEGLNCIGDQIGEARRFMSNLARRHPVFLTARQRNSLKDLAGNAERDDLIAALDVEPVEAA